MTLIAIPDSDLVRDGLDTDYLVHECDHAPSLRAPIFVLNVLRDGILARRITVLAASPESALFKAHEQLDDDETLSFCFTNTTTQP